MIVVSKWDEIIVGLSVRSKDREARGSPACQGQRGERINTEANKEHLQRKENQERRESSRKPAPERWG